MPEPENINYNLTTTTEVLVTSEAGDRISAGLAVQFEAGRASGNVISIDPQRIKQTIDGIGTSFSESSAFVLAHLEQAARQEVMEKIYGESGANFSLARTPIGATDFSVEGKYSYADVPGDENLQHFNIDVDSDGFDPARYAGIKDADFDLLPMIKQAIAIKHDQADKDFRIIASAWTAPSWMKDIDDWYINMAHNNHHGSGGSLQPEYVASYANYLTKYLTAYQSEGVYIWGLTPVNEPNGNNGQWESMHFTPESQNDFVKNYLGPALKSNHYEDLNLFVFDHNRESLEQWADVILGDPDSAQYVNGIAVHWYESSFRVYEDVLDRVHEKYPEFSIIHTEGCIDDLGKDAPQGVMDPIRYKESGWFDNDEFWWNDNATDWAYSATWSNVVVEDHPIYTPVHRYARNIIVSLNHWVTGWIDWNIVLDRNGGPNHVGNFCGAPIMIDVDTGYVYYTPVYYVLAQFSRTIRPGDRAVQADKFLHGLDNDTLHASATINDTGLLSIQILNTSKTPINYQLQIGAQYAEVEIAANALQTLRLQLGDFWQRKLSS